MKTVFSPASQVAHVWAQQSQDSGRNSGDTFYFTGDTIYSYGSHFPIARFTDTPHGGRVVLFTTETYSNTTAKHIGHVWSAVRGRTVFSLPPAAWNCEQGAQHSYAERVAGLLEQAKRARKYGPSYLRQAAELTEEANQCARAFGWAWTLEQDNAPDLIERLEREQATRDAEARRERAKRERSQRLARMRDTHAEYIAWRNGERAQCPTAWCPAFQRLAIHAGEVVTSMGASFPVEHAKRAIKPLERLLGHWQRFGGTTDLSACPIRLGHFTIDRIEQDGTVRAGCHRVTLREVHRIVKKLNAA